ncbi:hypothetical protein ABZP36_005361 [Zizania latifolia]
MAKKPAAAAIRSLFSADNPFRRKPSIEKPAPPVPTVTAAATPLGRHPNPEPQEAANSVVRKRDLKIRDRLLRFAHAKSADATPKKTMDAGKTKDGSKHKIALIPGSKSHEGSDKTKQKASTLSYQGLRASKSGVIKKVKVNQRPTNQGNQKLGKASEKGSDSSSRKAKRPAVAERKAKQLAKKRKMDARTPENTHGSTKAKK